MKSVIDRLFESSMQNVGRLPMLSAKEILYLPDPHVSIIENRNCYGYIDGVEGRHFWLTIIAALRAETRR